jgi:hypothetical protein
VNPSLLRHHWLSWSLAGARWVAGTYTCAFLWVFFCVSVYVCLCVCVPVCEHVCGRVHHAHSCANLHACVFYKRARKTSQYCIQTEHSVCPVTFLHLPGKGFPFLPWELARNMRGGVRRCSFHNRGERSHVSQFTLWTYPYTPHPTSTHT